MRGRILSIILRGACFACVAVGKRQQTRAQPGTSQTAKSKDGGSPIRNAIDFWPQTSSIKRLAALLSDAQASARARLPTRQQGWKRANSHPARRRARAEVSNCLAVEESRSGTVAGHAGCWHGDPKATSRGGPITADADRWRGRGIIGVGGAAEAP